MSFGSEITPLVKISFLVLAAVSHHVGFKSPNPPPAQEQAVYKGQFFEKIVKILALASRISTITVLVCESLLLAALNYPTSYSHHIIDSICPHPFPSLFLSGPILSLSFKVGISIMLLSAALRIWCFNSLGHLFTFEISIKPNHKLVTAGPYSYVRHPSYTACAFMLVGAALTCFASGSFLNECHIMSTPVKWPIRLWLVVAIFATVSLGRRVRVEDEGLREVFGETWDLYRRAVPRSFIPYVM